MTSLTRKQKARRRKYERSPARRKAHAAREWARRARLRELVDMEMVDESPTPKEFL